MGRIVRFWVYWVIYASSISELYEEDFPPGKGHLMGLILFSLLMFSLPVLFIRML